MQYNVQTYSSYGTCNLKDNYITFLSNQNDVNAFFTLQIDFLDWEEDAYVFMPSCVYNGNPFRCVTQSYPPMYTEDDIEECVTNLLPARHATDTKEIEVTSGDMAVPCVGVFYKQTKKALFLYTEQEVKEKNIGFTVADGCIQVSYPATRKYAYRFCGMFAENQDTGICVSVGETIRSRIQIKEFSCENIDEFFKIFFITRKSIMFAQREENSYTPELFQLMEKHFNNHNWSGQYYAEASKKWQCGWVGGGMSSYALLKKGQELSRERARKTLDFLTAHQADSGFYYGIVENGEIKDDGFGRPHMKNAHLIRKSGDALYFLFKHFAVESPKLTWTESAKKCADAFVCLYEAYGTFGQYVNVKTGEMMVAASCAGAIVIGALTRAYEYFHDEKYLNIAISAAQMYYDIFISQGATSGAIGDALCAYDSESAFAFIESYVALYECTKDKKWLSYAQAATHIAASWVVTYRYKFPKTSEFARLSINTVGSVFANIQNKHAAPGICTFSGDCIYKLYQYTGNALYLDLILDIVSFIPQCVSTEEKPIKANDGRFMPPGFINERVNMSDWEGFSQVGEVFYGTCWCETSLILTYVELIDAKGLTW